MPTHQAEMFIYDNIHFENGRKDQFEHPVVIAGVDENNVYCFAMTSQTKHIGKNSQTRNLYNSTIKYAETIPGKNCTTNNFIRGLVNTTQCLVVPLEQARSYPKFGYATPQLLNEIITKWYYQQNEIMDKKQYQFTDICHALGITDSIKSNPIYRACENLMRQFPNELQMQREYAKALREYREECLKIRRQQVHAYYHGQGHPHFPKEPKLQDDKSLYEKYSTIQLTEEEQLANSPFAGLAEALFGKDNSNNIETTAVNTNPNQTTPNVIDFEERKKELLELKQMLQNSQDQAQQQVQEQEAHHGRRAA